MVENELNSFNKTFEYNRNVSNNIKLGLFLSFQIPSIIYHIFIIYYLKSNRILRQGLHNHVILILLITNFCLITIDLSITLHFLPFGFIKKNQANLCLIWNFFDSFLSNLSTFLMMWASFERHILIFYDRQVLNTKFKRFFFHYLPLIILILYSFIFYMSIIFFNSSCSNKENFIYRKMTIQLVSVSFLYFVGIIPAAIGELLHLWEGLSNNIDESVIQEEIFLYLFYFISLILPFICLTSLPEIYSKIPFFIYFKRQLNLRTNQIAFIDTTTPRRIVNESF